ncbi:MAG: mannose-1-phosphate guanylyltransferase [Muribaculaceae bacterium]
MENVHVVIMAGGDGKRLWPVSNQSTPKQFVDVFGCGRTLIQLTFDRLKTICSERNFWVVTSNEYADLVRSQLPQLRDDHILLEPVSKNTAAATAYFTWKIKSVAPNAMVVLTNSDQMVTNYDYFANTIKSSIDFASSRHALVTVGIKPTRDEIHGFFEVEETPCEGDIYKVNRYMGRPEPEQLKSFMENERAYWNTSIMVASVAVIEESFRIHAPEMADKFDNLTPSLFSPREQYMLSEVLDSIKESISYERLVLQYATNTYLFCADMGWSDLGRWSDLLPFVSMARYGNLKVGNVKAFNCKNCIIEVPDAKVAVVDGLEDFVVAEKDGSLLICRLDNVKMIKEWSSEIEQPDRD